MEDILPIFVLNEQQGLKGRLVDIYWLIIMFVGYPLYWIIEWVHWETFGKGPRR